MATPGPDRNYAEMMHYLRWETALGEKYQSAFNASGFNEKRRRLMHGHPTRRKRTVPDFLRI